MRSPVNVPSSSATRLLPTLKVAFITIVVFTACFLPGAVSAKESDKEVYTGEVPVAADDGQRISIVIEKSDESEPKAELPESRVNNGIFADGDEGGEDSEGERPPSETTTYDKCVNGDCCYQYTWQGYTEQIPALQNSTCDYLWKEKRDESVACFDPIVFTIPNEGESRQNTPPNFLQLRDQARANNWNIFCPKPGKNCVTYTYYSSDSKTITNQTKFCGIVTDLNTDNRISNGCHKQKVSGFIREVCVCDRHLCNGGGSISQLSTYLPLAIAIATGAMLRLVMN